MSTEFDWYNPNDPIAVTTRDIIAHGTADPRFGKRRGMPLQANDERAAALRQVTYLGAHRGVAR